MKEIDGDAVCHENGLYYEGRYSSYINDLIRPKQDNHVEQGTGTTSYNCTYSHF